VVFILFKGINFKILANMQIFDKSVVILQQKYPFEIAIL
tara:strand:- start:738 stop:854 length:117 start_codon:yes stop_codon:yes gene_type:complete